MKFLINLGVLVLAAVALVVWVKLPWLGVGVLAVVLALWLGLTRTGRQTTSVTKVGIATLGQRLGSALVIVIGIAGVVGVLVALLAMGDGLKATMSSGGRDDTAIVMRAGSVSESQSVLVRDDVDAIEQAAGVARDTAGKPLASGELVVAVNLHQRGSGDDASAQVRGVDAAAWSLRPDLQIVAGRKFNPGMRELVAGEAAARQYAGLEVGKDIKLGSQVWTVVGLFKSAGAWNSELWADRQTVASVYRRGNSAESVLVKLTSAAALPTFKAAMAADPRLKVEASTTRAFFAKQSEGLHKLIRVVGLTVGGIMAIGALFGALNCMFAAVAARAREIATLRAIGFRGLPVVVSVMLETMLLALGGGVLGALVVWLIFNGYSASTLNGFSQVMFTFKVGPQLIGTGLKWALAIGFVGGLFPAVRAARLPVTTALREL